MFSRLGLHLPLGRACQYFEVFKRNLLRSLGMCTLEETSFLPSMVLFAMDVIVVRYAFADDS